MRALAGLVAVLALLLAGFKAGAQESAELEARPFVRGFRVRGNTVLPEAEIRAALAPFTGRRLGAEDLIAARDALTRLYADRGYTTSSAFLPDQRVSGGIVELRAEEGRLEDVHVSGVRHLRQSRLRARLLREARGPLQPERLRETLQTLQEGPHVERVRATLVPGSRPGLSQLDVHLSEPAQTSWLVHADNAATPGVGSQGAELRLLHHNLLGVGDGLEVASGMTRGLRSHEALYALPLGARDTRLELRYRASHADVVDEPFDALDIASRWRVLSAGVWQPVRLRSGLLGLGVQADWVRSRTYLDDHRFGFARGSEDGETRITALRGIQEWVQRDLDSVWAARSTLSFGIDAFDASDAGGGAPDGTFFAWLGQAQWARRLDDWLGGAQLSARTDVQLTPRSLLVPERFSLGGAYSVRGYRENQLVRDNGVVGSIELRVPLLRGLDGTDRLQLATFLDAGHGWDHESSPGPKTLAAVGLGLRMRLGSSSLGTLYWGIPLRHVSRSGDDWLQNHGLHLSFTYWPGTAQGFSSR